MMNSTESSARAEAALAFLHAGTLYAFGTRPFLIGRGWQCDLTLQNTSVSRRHALVTRMRDGWVIDDLGSRNGVFVNARRVLRPMPLAAGDSLAIADEVVQVVPALGVNAPASSRQSGVRSKAALGLTTTTPMDGFALFMSAVDQALLRGRSLEAERLFAVHLGRPAENAAAHGRLDARTAEALSLLALRLGEATGSGVWLDFVLRLYASRAAVAPCSVVSGMHWLSHRLGGVNRTALKQYLVQVSRAELRAEDRGSLDRLHALSAARFGEAAGPDTARGGLRALSRLGTE
jgi:pSer/pThr/pTyr-binding forkhead associated (FHA) protein